MHSDRRERHRIGGERLAGERSRETDRVAWPEQTEHDRIAGRRETPDRHDPCVDYREARRQLTSVPQ